MIRSLSPSTTQGDLLAMLDQSGMRLKASSGSRSSVVYVDFKQPSAERFLRMYCAATQTKGVS